MQTDLPFWKIYLDTCCLNRLLDPPIQTRVIKEAKAVRQILTYFISAHWHWISSKVVTDEIEQTPDMGKRTQVKTWLTLPHQTVSVGTREVSRGLQLQSLGFKEQDALHLACAESGAADILLTTDDRLINRAQRYRTRLHIQVENPATWLQEVTGSGYFRDDGS